MFFCMERNSRNVKVSNAQKALYRSVSVYTNYYSLLSCTACSTHALIFYQLLCLSCLHFEIGSNENAKEIVTSFKRFPFCRVSLKLRTTSCQLDLTLQDNSSWCNRFTYETLIEKHNRQKCDKNAYQSRVIIILGWLIHTLTEIQIRTALHKITLLSILLARKKERPKGLHTVKHATQKMEYN